MVTVHDLIPMIHVADVEASARFYAHLGFVVERRMTLGDGRTNWASLRSGEARIMFAVAGPPIVAESQGLILYLYTTNVARLREQLLVAGLADGGDYCGQPGPNGGRQVVFAVGHPLYMPAGEIRVADPDGYCLLVGQLA